MSIKTLMATHHAFINSYFLSLSLIVKSKNLRKYRIYESVLRTKKEEDAHDMSSPLLFEKYQKWEKTLFPQEY